MSLLSIVAMVVLNTAGLYGVYRLVALADDYLDAKTSAKVHRAAMSFWAVQFVVVWLLPPAWRIPYIVTASIYANLVGHWSGASAERPSQVEE